MVYNRRWFITTAFELCFWELPENQLGLEFNGTYQLLPYADDVNLLRDYKDTINKNKETLFDANKELGLQINAAKTKYMLLSHHQNEGQIMK
jgi:hypothetical protein